MGHQRFRQNCREIFQLYIYVSHPRRLLSLFDQKKRFLLLLGKNWISLAKGEKLAKATDLFSLFWLINYFDPRKKLQFSKFWCLSKTILLEENAGLVQSYKKWGGGSLWTLDCVKKSRLDKSCLSKKEEDVKKQKSGTKTASVSEFFIIIGLYICQEKSESQHQH